MLANTARILTALLAALAVSALPISACTCSHHIETAESISCGNSHTSGHVHHVSHDHGEKSLQTKSGLSFDSPCVCVTASPAPAVVGKSDTKPLKLQKDLVAANTCASEFSADPVEYITANVVIRAVDVYSSRPTGLLPSRAPPCA